MTVRTIPGNSLALLPHLCLVLPVMTIQNNKWLITCYKRKNKEANTVRVTTGLQLECSLFFGAVAHNKSSLHWLQVLLEEQVLLIRLSRMLRI